MILYQKSKIIRKKTVQGGGLFNNIINTLPFELHLPVFQYLGPGTFLKKRLARGDPGVNKLDEACKIHDIFYSQNEDLNQRHQADQELAESAWQRVKAKDSSVGEKFASYIVANAMKAKVKMGLGMRKKNLNKKCGNKIFNNAVIAARKMIKQQKPLDVKSAVKLARCTIKKSFKGKKSKIVIPRIMRVPKIGGFLPIGLLTALGLAANLANGVAGIVKTFNSAKNAKKQLDEDTRHNKKMESIAIGKGLYLKPYKKGYGIIFHKNETKNL